LLNIILLRVNYALKWTWFYPILWYNSRHCTDLSRVSRIPVNDIWPVRAGAEMFSAALISGLCSEGHF